MSIEDNAPAGAPPPMPPEYRTDPAVRASYEQALRAHFEGRAQAPDPHGNVAQFDQEMRAAGTQRADTPSGGVDQTALKFLTDWRMANPKASIDQLRIFERDLASVMAGRRMHESLEAFNARTAARPVAQPAAPAPVELDPEIYRPVTELGPEHLHGYTLPDMPAGIHTNFESLSEQLAAARSAGISEAQVQHVIRTLAAKAV